MLDFLDPSLGQTLLTRRSYYSLESIFSTITQGLPQSPHHTIFISLKMVIICPNVLIKLTFTYFSADILKEFNPNIKGFSTGTGDQNPNMNVGAAGATVQ